MPLSAFADRARPPQEADLVDVLGASYPAWVALRGRLPDLAAAWGYTASSTGWGLRLKEGTRAIVYMTPREGHFLASFALGERAVAAARGADLPAPVMDAIEGARKYAEGRGVRLVVAGTDDVDAIATLAAIKRAH